jgi:hypothetical protein
MRNSDRSIIMGFVLLALLGGWYGPVMGQAVQYYVNGLTVTATTGTLTLANGKTLTVNNTLTFAGTDGQTMTFPSTPATIARTDAANTFIGVQTMTSPVLTTPALGTPSALVLTNATGLVNAGIVNSTIDLTAKVTGLLPVANGGTTCALPFAVLPETSTYQALAADFTCMKTITIASGTFTITLVANTSQPANGTWLKVINYGSGVVTIARNGQNLNGGTTSLTAAAGSATAPTRRIIHSDGTNYFVE